MTPENAESEGTKRTTLRLPSSLYDDVAKLAAKKHRSLNQEIIEILYEYILDSLLPRSAFEDVTRAHFLGMHVGALLSIDTSQIEAEGCSEEQVAAVVEAIANYLRKRRAEAEGKEG